MSAEPAHTICPPKPPAHKVRRGPRERLREALLELAEGRAEIVDHNEKSWASITFSGTRNHIQLIFNGADSVQAGEHFIAALSDHEFAIPGQLVADATVTSVEHSLLPEPRMLVECELLLLIDA